MTNATSKSAFVFRVGEKYTHEEVYRGLEVGNAGGIGPCIGKGGELRRLVVMTSVPTARIASENPYHDRVEGSVLVYTAAGREGNQFISGMNKRLVEQLDAPFPIYGFQNIIKLLAEQNPPPDIVPIIGGDSLRDLPKCHEPQKLVYACHWIGVMRRPHDESNLDELESQLPEISSKVHYVDAPLLEIASREIRSRIAKGRIRPLLSAHICVRIHQRTSSLRSIVNPKSKIINHMSLLFDALFSSVALRHFMVDVFNSSRPVLLTYLGLSETQIALISTIYIWTSAMTQPFFGWASDRVGPRWLAAGGVLWMTVFYTAAALVPGPGGHISLIVTPLASSSFHPVGTTQATLQGRHRIAGFSTE